MLDEWTFLALQKYAGFQAFQSVPHVFRDVNTIGSTSSAVVTVWLVPPRH